MNSAIERSGIEAAMRQLEQRDLLVEKPIADGQPRWELTPKGCQVFAKLVAARRERLAELLSDWRSERHERMAELLGQLAEQLLTDGPSRSGVSRKKHRSTAPRSGTRSGSRSNL